MHIGEDVKKFLKIIGISIVAFIVIIVGILFWADYKSEEVIAEATPFIEESMPLVTTWNVDNFRHLFTPEGLAGFDSEKGRKITAYLSKVGQLKSFDTPVFVESNSIVTASGDRKNIVVFTVKARFENGDGALTFILVRTGVNYLIQGVNLNSDVFLEL